MLSSVFATELVIFKAYEKDEFSPTRNQSFKIPFHLNQKAEVKISIYAPDGDKVTMLSSKKELLQGDHFLSWNGKDSEGIIVPDEAYSVVLEAKNSSGSVSVVNPSAYSGGEIETKTHLRIDTNGKIFYQLSKPSRVLIRAGIKNGPMMRSLANWQPRTSGKNVQHWNGFDEDGVVNVISKKEHGVIVVAFALSEHSIITSGNKKLSYEQYYKDKKWTFKPIAKEKQLRQRGDVGISPHYYASRMTDKDPRINIGFPLHIKKNKEGVVLIKNDKAIPIKVTMPMEDEIFIEQSKYEVSFFIDQEFKSEEELGFMPITWLWSPNGFSKGEHIISVNVSGFKGQVGVKNMKFIIE